MSQYDKIVVELIEAMNPLTGQDDDAMRINRRRRVNSELKQVQVRDLRPGMVVVDEIGCERTVTEYPKPARQRPYLYVVTDGEPVNTQGGNLVDVKIDSDERFNQPPRPTLPGSGRINPKWSKAWDRGEDV